MRARSYLEGGLIGKSHVCSRGAASQPEVQHHFSDSDRPGKVRVLLPTSPQCSRGCEEGAELRGWETSTSQRPHPGAARGSLSTPGPPWLLHQGSCAIQWRRPGPAQAEPSHAAAQPWEGRSQALEPGEHHSRVQRLRMPRGRAGPLEACPDPGCARQGSGGSGRCCIRSPELPWVLQEEESTMRGLSRAGLQQSLLPLPWKSGSDLC